MTKIKDTATAILRFEEAATKHAEATEQGDYKTANKNYAVIVKAITFLKEQDEVQKLSELLNHSSAGVRMWAATYLLPVSESEGLRVLKQIEEETGIHSFTAKITISEWGKGNLKL
jgi:hypothetical protein